MHWIGSQNSLENPLDSSPSPSNKGPLEGSGAAIGLHGGPNGTVGDAMRDRPPTPFRRWWEGTIWMPHGLVAL